MNDIPILIIGTSIALVISLFILISRKFKSFYAFLTPLFPGIVFLVWGFFNCDDMGCGLAVFMVLSFLTVSSIINSFAVAAYLLFNKHYNKNLRTSLCAFLIGVLIPVLGLYTFTYIRDSMCSLNYDNWCLISKAQSSKDALFCEKAKSKEDKEFCYFGISRTWKDADICEKTANDLHRNYKYYCAVNVAKNTQNKQICDILDESQREKCYADFISGKSY